MPSADPLAEAAIATLHRLNLELGDQERRGADGAAFFEEILDERLCFRRRDGSTVDRAGFLAGLHDPRNRSDVLDTTIRQVQVFGDQAAFVEAWVYLKGTRGDRTVDGTFRNLRLFELRDGSWRLVMWFNKRLEAEHAG